ncbi:MAG: hypothetical protein FWE68_01280 [Defluviitaleaceae bacterium]|nr:hypothetical protein [Defluviitaleaceae bacterium]
MIDFKTEIEKYKPALSVDEVEGAVYSDEVKDVVELLQHITQKIGQ